MKAILITIAILLASYTHNAFATPHCRQCPYSCYDLGLGNKDCSFISESRGVCCVDLTKKGLELAFAQEQVMKHPGSDRPLTNNEHCPSGFRPSENKCTPQERARGCKDMRLPGGLGCVKR